MRNDVRYVLAGWNEQEETNHWQTCPANKNGTHKGWLLWKLDQYCSILAVVQGSPNLDPTNCRSPSVLVPPGKPWLGVRSGASNRGVGTSTFKKVKQLAHKLFPHHRKQRAEFWNHSKTTCPGTNVIASYHSNIYSRYMTTRLKYVWTTNDKKKHDWLLALTHPRKK